MASSPAPGSRILPFLRSGSVDDHIGTPGGGVAGRSVSCALSRAAASRGGSRGTLLSGLCPDCPTTCI
jgi:hypothetical protein